jgi:threonine dehydrogenase-like Zn-dependent dehydrogenase
LDDDIPWPAGVLLAGDGLGVPYHSSRRVQGEGIQTVAVLGTGPIGLGSVLLQSWLGRRVAAVDVAQYRLDKARELGAEVALDAGEGEVVERLRAFSGAGGVDVAIEAAGRPETAMQCFAAVRTGGTVVFNGEQGPIELSPSKHFIRRDVAAVGLWYYHACEFPEMVDLQRRGLRVERLVSHEFPAAEAQEAFAEFAAARTAKVLLRWTD